MPELPEVEVTRLSLAPHLEGARVLAVSLGKPLRWPLGCDPRGLAGLTVGTPQRRGKYIWLPLHRSLTSTAAGGSAGAATRPAPQPGGLLVHLGMSGSLGLSDGRAPVGPHDHFEMKTDRGTLRLNDPRRFGAVVWSERLDSGMAAKLLSGLGREPFDPSLSPGWFHEQLQRRRAPIKQVLLAGDVIVGAGNIYACEALFDAGIDPRTPAARLSRPRSARLLQAVQHTLAQALSLGGTTLRDFKDAHGMSGAFQHQARVYDREGLPCTACGAPIRRIVMGQRSTYFCPKCQRR